MSNTRVRNIALGIVLRKDNQMKKERKIFKGELGYGTKKKALDDMGKDNKFFDNLNNMFLNEEQIDYGLVLDSGGNSVEMGNLDILV